MTVAAPPETRGSRIFDASVIDNSPVLLRRSYALRYQVYCLERRFLPAADYPDGIEVDEFDRRSIHVAVLDESRQMAGTARLVRPDGGRLPAFDHCQLFPGEEARWNDRTGLVEVSRLSVSRQYGGIIRGTAADDSRPARQQRDGRRSDRGDVFLAIVRVLYRASRREGMTHWLMAIEASLHRFLSRSGFPLRQVGPEADYFGPVALYVMDLDEFDDIIHSGRFPKLTELAAELEAGDSWNPELAASLPLSAETPEPWPL